MRPRYHAATLFGLLVLAGLVQAVVIGRAAVPSLDAVRFVKTAQLVAQQGPLAILHDSSEQPLFPLWVATVHAALASGMGESPSLWATSVQLAAAIPLVLTLVPLYFLLVRLFGPRIATVGSILFCILPEANRLAADGISDSAQLFFFTAAVWAIVEGLHHNPRLWQATEMPKPTGVPGPKRSGGPEACGVPLLGRTPPDTPTITTDSDGVRSSSAASFHGLALLHFALAGLFTGLALLARAEAILLPVALALSAVAFCAIHRSRTAFRVATAATLVYALGLILVLGPCLALAGPATPQAAVARVLGRAPAVASRPSGTTGQPSSWHSPDGRPLHFAVKEGSIRRQGYAAAACQFGEELADVFGYWLGPLALWALWRHRRELTRPADRFLQVFFVIFSLAVMSFVAAEGYLSARHLLPLLIVGLGPAALGVCDAVGLLTTLPSPFGRGAGGEGLMPQELGHPRRSTQTCPRERGHGTLLALCTVMMLLVAAHLAAAGHCLRADRLGHRQAGDWLARQPRDGLAVLDTRGWTALYSARPTYQYNQAKAALRDPRLGYLVVEPAELDYPSDRARTLRYLLATAGRCVARFGEPSGDSPHTVAVYRWRADRFVQALAQAERIDP